MSNQKRKKRKVNKTRVLKKKIDLIFNKIINSLSKRRKLRTIYNSPDTSGFTPQDYQLELDLYNTYKAESNNEEFSLLSLPADNPLIQIIENKRNRFLYYWNSKRAPVGGGLKTDEQIIKDFLTLRYKNWRGVLVEDADKNRNILRDYSPQDSGLVQLFPEMMDVPTTNGSIIDGLRDRVRFLEAYESKIFKDGFHELESDYSNFYRVFIQMMRRGCGSHPVVNFPSPIAQYIVLEAYHDTIKRNNGIEGDNFVILDPAAGWLGRLLGVLCSFHEMRSDYQRRFHRKLHVSYICTDPNKDVHERFRLLVYDWFELFEPKDSIDYFHFNKETLGCETPEFLQSCQNVLRDLHVPGVNVALTSPPYFSQEKYSIDKAQSFLMYPTYQLWVDGFLNDMISNVYQLLQPECRFYLNIADTKKASKKYSLEFDSVRLMKERGMEEVIQYKMLLSGYQKEKRDNNIKVGNIFKKFEPVFVFQKANNSNNQ